jgi:putative ABC transport system permease protein
MMTPTEVERGRPVAIVGWDIADRLFGQTNPLDKTIRIAGIQFDIVGVSKKKGAAFGQSQDAFAVIPLGAYMRLFGARQSLTLLAKPSSPEVLDAAMDDATVALRVARHLKPAEPDNFGMLSSDTVLGLYAQATNGIFAVLSASSPSRSSSAASSS